MGLFKKELKGTVKNVYKVKIGYREFCFSSQEDALTIYNALSTCPMFSIGSTMIDDAVVKEKGGYRPYKHYHFIDKPKAVSLETEEVTIYAEDEVIKLAKERDEELEKIDAKSKKKS